MNWKKISDYKKAMEDELITRLLDSSDNVDVTTNDKGSIATLKRKDYKFLVTDTRLYKSFFRRSVHLSKVAFWGFLLLLIRPRL